MTEADRVHSTSISMSSPLHPKGFRLPAHSLILRRYACQTYLLRQAQFIVNPAQVIVTSVRLIHASVY